MATNPNRVTVPGSERLPLIGARAVGPVPKDERFEVTVRVRRKTSLQSFAANGVQADQLPGKRSYVTREQYAPPTAPTRPISQKSRPSREHTA